MIKRKMHDATPEELQRSVDDIDTEIEILRQRVKRSIRQRIKRSSYRDAIFIDNVSFSLLQEWKAQERELTERKNDLLLQIQERKEDHNDV